MSGAAGSVVMPNAKRGVATFHLVERPLEFAARRDEARHRLTADLQQRWADEFHSGQFRDLQQMLLRDQISQADYDARLASRKSARGKLPSSVPVRKRPAKLADRDKCSPAPRRSRRSRGIRLPDWQDVHDRLAEPPARLAGPDLPRWQTETSGFLGITGVITERISRATRGAVPTFNSFPQTTVLPIAATS